MNKISSIKIGNKTVGENKPCYVIAEVGSNFDGSLARAKKLAKLAKDSGADAFKIQNFIAEKIVSNRGFKDLKISFQSNWDKPVVEVYKKAEFPRKWIKNLKEYCDKIDIEFLSSPYDMEAVDLLDSIGVKAFKIGSGEIDNLDFLKHVAKKKKPIIIGCGSSTFKEVTLAINTIKKAGNNKIVLLQCVTNYPSPVAEANLRAMQVFRKKFTVNVGYSDHTIGMKGGGDDPLNGITVPLGAVAMGAVMLEKHFSDDVKRKGPDHPFAMEVAEFKKMIDSIRALEKAFGDGKKRIMPSEKETYKIQRRGIYAKSKIKRGSKIKKIDLEFLRPAISLRPPEYVKVVGKVAKHDIESGEPIYLKDVH